MCLHFEVKVDGNGTIVIPEDVLKLFPINVKDRFCFKTCDDKDSIIIEKL